MLSPPNLAEVGAELGKNPIFTISEQVYILKSLNSEKCPDFISKISWNNVPRFQILCMYEFPYFQMLFTLSIGPLSHPSPPRTKKKAKGTVQGRMGVLGGQKKDYVIFEWSLNLRKGKYFPQLFFNENLSA